MAWWGMEGERIEFVQRATIRFFSCRPCHTGIIHNAMHIDQQIRLQFKERQLGPNYETTQLLSEVQNQKLKSQLTNVLK